MLRSIHSIIGFSIHATDGEIGKVDDLFFDDMLWNTAYLVVRTGGWLDGRRVLIPPTALESPDWESHRVPVTQSKDDIKRGPGVDLDKPVSRRYEIELHKYYGWTPYWVPGTSYAMGSLPLQQGLPEAVDEDSDPHLRSFRAVVGYHIQATDGAIGHAQDLIVDDETGGWPVRYLAINTANWLPGREVIISPEWISRIVWSEERIYISFNRDMVRRSPEYDPSMPINREYEVRLYDFYGRPSRWANDPRR